MSKKVSLNGRMVGEGESAYVIAEGGLTNWGDLSLAKKQVDAAMAAGCDAVKFQAQTTEAMVSKVVDPYWYRRVKYKELSHAALKELWEYCAIRNIQCFMTAHTDIDLEFLDKELNVPFFKIGSGESLNQEFLANVGGRGKPVIISLGLHLTDDEIRTSVGTLEKAGCKDIVILHCNTVYPTPPEMNDLRMIERLRGMFEYPIGYSDHTEGEHMVLAAIGLGATVIEKHISFDRRDLRSLDCPGSGTPEEWKDIVQHIRQVESALRPPPQSKKELVVKGRAWATQSIVAARDIKEGETVTRELLALKRPGTGLGSESMSKILGKKAAKSIQADAQIRESDVG